jgi:TPR repeat protein
MSELGVGAPKDGPKAISLYEKAAAQNLSISTEI